MVATPPEPALLSVSARKDKLDVSMEFEDVVCSHARFALCTRLIRKHHTAKLVSEALSPRKLNHKELRQYLVEELDVSLVEESVVLKEEVVVTESLEASYAVAVTCAVSCTKSLQSFTVEMDSLLPHALAQCRGLDEYELTRGEWELELVLVPLSNVVVSKDDESAHVAIISPLGLETVLSLARARSSVDLSQTPMEMEQRYGGLIEQMRRAYIQRTHPPKMNGVLLTFPSPHVSRAPSICPSPVGKLSPLLEAVIGSGSDEQLLLPCAELLPVEDMSEEMDMSMESAEVELPTVVQDAKRSPTPQSPSECQMTPQLSASLSPRSPDGRLLDEVPKPSRSPSTTSATLSVGTNELKRLSEDEEDPLVKTWTHSPNLSRRVVVCHVPAPVDELTQ